MKLMNIKVIYPHSNTSKPDSDHQKYPYLLRDVVIDRANQVRSTDITARAAPLYPNAEGFYVLYGHY